MKTNQVKMKILAKVLNVICNVVYWVVVAGFGLFLLGNIVLLFGPKVYKRKELILSR